MGKPIAIFMGIRATENKVSVLTQCLMLVYCFMVYKVFYIHFLCGSQSNTALSRNYYWNRKHKRSEGCSAHSRHFTKENMDADVKWGALGHLSCLCSNHLKFRSLDFQANYFFTTSYWLSVFSGHRNSQPENICLCNSFYYFPLQKL